jgi:hypothetical protein
MMKILGAALSFFLTTFAFAASPESDAVLNTLGANLREGRSLPMGAKTTYRCPEGLANVVGTSIETVLPALPAPDFKTENQVSYVLSAPLPARLQPDCAVDS